MTIGFIGAGNMAGAIVRGARAAGLLAGPDVRLFDAEPRAAEHLAQQTGAHVTGSAEELVAAADIVVLAIKPQVLPAVVTKLSAALAERRPLIVSIAAGTDLARLTALLPAGLPVVRVMPNVNAMVGAGMAAVCGNDVADEHDVARVRELFDAVGATVVLPEADFATFTAIAGSAPAFVFDLIDALAAGAVEHGMPKAQAVSIAAQTVLGSARTVIERTDDGQTPADLADMVSSPAGTTIAGRLAMARAGFAPAVLAGVRAVVDRDREMASED